MLEKKPKRKSLILNVNDLSNKLIVEELPEETVHIEIPTETGETITQKVTTKRIKKKQGNKEQVIELKTVEEPGKEPETEVILVEAHPIEATVEESIVHDVHIVNEPKKPETPVEEQPKPKKKKMVKKGKKDDKFDDYIQQLIDAEIPKTELEEFESPEFEAIEKKKPMKKSLVPKVSSEEAPAELVIEELPEEVVHIEIPTEEGETVRQKVTTKKIKKKHGDKEQVIEVKTIEEAGKEPEIEVIVCEAQPIEPVFEILEEKPLPTQTPTQDTEKVETIPEQQPKMKKKKIVKKPKKTNDLDEIQKLIDAEIPKTELEVFEKPEFEEKEKKKPKSKSLVPKVSSKGEAPSALVVEELPEQIVNIELPTDEGATVTQKITTKIIKKKQGDQEQVIEVKTIEQPGEEPQTQITVEETQAADEEDKPRKKKIIKKVKKDDNFDDYIQSLIDAEIPKTELEEFEKPEFEPTEKIKIPKKKSLTPITLEESPVELIVEELPEETVHIELPTDQGETITQKVTTKKIKKKQGDQVQFIEVKTIEQPGEEPQTQVTIEEILPTESITEIIEPTSIEELKPKKKKVVKKVKKDDKFDNYIQSLIEAEIPKTDLEEFEKPEFEATEKKKPKKKSLIPKVKDDQPIVEDSPVESVKVKMPAKLIEDDNVETSSVTLAPPKKDTISDQPIEESPEEIVHIDVTPKEEDQLIVEEITERITKKHRSKKAKEDIDKEYTVEESIEPDIIPDEEQPKETLKEEGQSQPDVENEEELIEDKPVKSVSQIDKVEESEITEFEKSIAPEKFPEEEGNNEIFVTFEKKFSIIKLITFEKTHLQCTFNYYFHYNNSIDYFEFRLEFRSCYYWKTIRGCEGIGN